MRSFVLSIHSRRDVHISSNPLIHFISILIIVFSVMWKHLEYRFCILPNELLCKTTTRTSKSSRKSPYETNVSIRAQRRSHGSQNASNQRQERGQPLWPERSRGLSSIEAASGSVISLGPSNRCQDDEDSSRNSQSIVSFGCRHMSLRANHVADMPSGRQKSTPTSYALRRSCGQQCHGDSPPRSLTTFTIKPNCRVA